MSYFCSLFFSSNVKDLNKLPGNVKNKAKQKLVSASKNNSAVVLTTIMSSISLTLTTLNDIWKIRV